MHFTVIKFVCFNFVRRAFDLFVRTPHPHLSPWPRVSYSRRLNCAFECCDNFIVARQMRYECREFFVCREVVQCTLSALRITSRSQTCTLICVHFIWHISQIISCTSFIWPFVRTYLIVLCVITLYFCCRCLAMPVLWFRRQLSLSVSRTLQRYAHDTNRHRRHHTHAGHLSLTLDCEQWTLFAAALGHLFLI